MRLRSFLLSLFYPRTCPMCEEYIGECEAGREIPNGSLCPQCLAELPRTEQAEIRENLTEMALTRTNSLTVRDPGQQMVRVKKAMHLVRAAAFLFFSLTKRILFVTSFTSLNIRIVRRLVTNSDGRQRWRCSTRISSMKST